MPLFTYGTLLFPEVLRALLGRVPQSQSASAAGWRVAALANRSYPGLVEAPGEISHGRLLTGLSSDEWRLLDNFEDRRYELRRIVALPTGELNVCMGRRCGSVLEYRGSPELRRDSSASLR